MNNALNLSAPLYLRLNAWFQDRFPIVNGISGALSYITMISVGRHSAGIPVTQFSWFDILGILAFVGHLLLLRIFDEHKDYAVDKINHPERALSKGLITLRHLKLIAITLPILSFWWSFSNTQDGGATLILWLIMFTYSLLMAKEFFIGQWLSKRLVLYSISHMLVSPLMILWIIVYGSNQIHFNSTIILILIVSFTSGFSYELTRKTRGDDEDKNLDAYNKSFGTKGCISLITFFNFLSLVLGLYIIDSLTTLNFSIRDLNLEFRTSTLIAIGCLGIGYISTIYPTINFIKKKTEKARKINEGGLGLFFLGLYISILFALFI